MVAALDDDAHERDERERYERRREGVCASVQSARLEVDQSEAGLYIWGTRGEP